MATLIFISGRGSVISSTQEGKSGSVYLVMFFLKLFELRKREPSDLGLYFLPLYLR